MFEKSVSLTSLEKLTPIMYFLTIFVGKRCLLKMAEVILRSAIPDKEDNLSYNLRDTAAFDLTAFDSKHDDLTAFSRKNVQLLLNRVFSLPLSASSSSGPMVILPAASESAVQLPRALPLPKPTPLTRWEKYQKDRGVSTKKRGRMVWDETAKDWVPRWGAGSVKHNEDRVNNWLIETPVNSTEDPFEKKALAQQLLKSKQKLREMRNQLESEGQKLPAGVSHVKDKRGKEAVHESLARAQKSTASIGKFDRKVAGELATVKTVKRTKPMIAKDAKTEVSQAAKLMAKVLGAPMAVSRATELKKNKRVSAADSSKKGKQSKPRKSTRKGKQQNED